MTNHFKYMSWHSNTKYQLFTGCRFFNPFKKHDPNLMISIFNFLPQLGIGLDRRFSTMLIKIGWLNFELTISISKVKINKSC